MASAPYFLLDGVSTCLMERRERFLESGINPSKTMWRLIGKMRAWRSYLNPITIEFGPTSGSTRVFENPASRIQA
jgi:hypothetical protein